jgi:hypothetical protein
MSRPTSKGVILFVMAILVTCVAGLAFMNKMTEFVLTIVHDDVAGFGIVSVATYLMGMLPLLLLTLWAAFSGRFRDIERPKYRMFELDQEIERGGELGPEPHHG